MPRAVPVLLAACAVAWVAILLAAPVALAHGYVTFPAVVYQAGGLICHQRAERSFHLLGIQLPVCARCLGLYASGAVGAVAACGFGRGRPARSDARVLLAIAAIPTAVTLIGEWAGLWYPTGAARAMAAIPLGLCGAYVLVASLVTAARPAAQVRYHS
ncbi:MAG: DUF2085 domain-containing protein [Vicinamibacterales bacterium]